MKETSPWPPAARALWTRLCAHDLDAPESALPFTQRLAQDNHWSLEFAASVVQEYRRFVFLALVTDHAVTPSDAVDQAWHLHLLYTRDYWGTFCPDVLGRALHHGPTEGGPAESHRFDRQYSQTRHSYFQWFGEHPPAAIWPKAAERFGRDTRWVRVNQDECHILPRVLPRWPTVARIATRLPSRIWRSLRERLRPASTTVAALIACRSIAAQDARPDNLWDAYGNPFALSAGAFLTFFIVASLVTILVTAFVGRHLWWVQARGLGGGAKTDVFETALMFGGGHRVVEVALTVLAEGGHVRFEDHACVAESPPPSDAHPLVQDLYDIVSAGPVDRRTMLWHSSRTMGPALRDMVRSLEQRGLLFPAVRLPRWPARIGYLIPLAISLPRIGFALGADRPFDVLALLTVGAVVVNYMAHNSAWRRFGRLTEGGRSIRRQYRALYKNIDSNTADPAYVAAVLGIGALAETDLGDVANDLARSGGFGGGFGGGGAFGGGRAGGCGG